MADDAEAWFYAAQDAADVGRARDAARLYERAIDACGTLHPIARDADLWPRAGPPSASARAALIASVASNALGELRLDEALEAGFPSRAHDCEPLRAAVARFEAALRAWPYNAPALCSLAQICRDSGRAEQALALLDRLLALSTLDAAQDDACSAWRAAWVFTPRRAAVAAGAMTAALVRSQRGEHAAATPILRRFGLRLRLSPAVWAAAAAPASHALPCPAPRLTAGQAAVPPVRLFADAVPPALASTLCAAFAPGAAFWRQTGYHTASVEKRYFTFFYDVRAARPSNAVEALIAHLHPLLARDDVACAEWWAHTRPVGRHPGHELHYDLEEGVMEASGRVLHPLVSSVVYLSGSAKSGPTIVLDERLDAGQLARRCWLAHPRTRALLTFDGALLHGVLPVDGPVGDEHRLTLLVAWYGEDARRASSRRRSALRPQGAVPRVSRRTTWPLDIPLDMACGGEEELAQATASALPATTRELPIVEIDHPWEEVTMAPHGVAVHARPRRSALGARAEAALEIPTHLDQHFFLRSPDDVACRHRV
ncbi:hypothetical protein KFE25_008110 [Diacronema lutheri]|uniref:Uncharacterized protein n=1 Tax=Diacronema lutheri TaxID=2081491 RepID=A0A8J6CD37_DIALT|nr:hypothetical protein KFE25_008110 [Diacronema lutheri]